MIRVVIAEDQTMVLGALAALLEIERDIEVVGRAASGDEALATVAAQRPDVLLTDIEMPGLGGIDLAKQVTERFPATRVLILTTFSRAGYLRRALDAGAQGYLLKDSKSEELANAVRRVHAGLRAVSPELAQEAWTERDPLSSRERQVLRLAIDGANGNDIATALGLSEGTVRNYLSDAIAKVGARNRVEAARLAREKGWL
ncbi:MAG TPA: response regulator transcription factor [Gemmatimonadaceae bacterium]|nr:response regulator transcription factor [Gemmatimonadaceae bacterium]